MQTIKLTLAYDGSDYAGWQIQQNTCTIQETLERAIERVVGRQVRVTASGRTDAGVHAMEQVASCDLETHLSTDVIHRAINAHLPHDIRVLEVCHAPPGFHAIVDAIRKHYRYAIQDRPVPDLFRRRYSWHIPKQLDDQAMAIAAQSLIGRHDFSSFETAGSERKTSVRTITRFDVARHPTGLTIDVEADGFLYNMVRNLVGTLVQVGRGVQSGDWPAEVLAKHDRSAAGPTAPPQGLFLVNVEYPETIGRSLPVRRDGID